MDKKKLFMFKKFSVIISLLVAVTVSSTDPQFEACRLQSCSRGPNITYPFFIDGVQGSFCGYPGFGLSCKNGDPVLEISSEDYIIREIMYDDHYFTITKAGVLSNEICSPLTYRLNFEDSPFTFVSSNVNLSIFFNCSALPSDYYSRYSFGCSTDDPRHRSLAMFSNDPVLNYVNESGRCETFVSTPVDKIGNGGPNTSMSRDFIEDFLSKGFSLSWDAADCNECAESGGRCGFDEDMYKFVCFCPDRPRPKRCKHTKTVHPRFKACVPKSCGKGPNITYPFSINGTQRSTCGYPGFDLTCKNGSPVVKISEDNYIIREIFYENQTFIITKATPSIETCSPITYRLNFDNSPFTLASANVNLSIFFNCTALLSNQYSRYSFGCSTDDPRHRSLAMFSNDPALNYVNKSGQCETSISTPFDNIGNRSSNRSMSKDFIQDFLNRGFYLRWNAADCTECAESGGRCGFDYKTYKFMCFCPDRPHPSRCKDEDTIRGGKKLGIAFGTTMGIVFMSIVFFLCWKRLYSSPNSLFFWKRDKKAQREVEDFLTSYGSLAPKRYNYYDIKTMTGSFKDKIGQGGYGGVYKGKLVDGQIVAVKLLNKAKGDGKEFMNEVASISKTSHVNVVSLLGFCFDGSKRALIYEFMVNGSLEKFIYHPNPMKTQSRLGWETLYRIAVGTARGLEYLHRGCNTRILHFDIKPHNILLDQDFIPKISDFGLAKLCPRNESIISMKDARGTAGYIAPEVFSRQFGGVSHKSDVYSYGMMVLEIVGRRKNIDVGVNHTSEIYFPHWIYKRLKLDEELGLHGVTSKEDRGITRKMISVALWCIQTNPMDRPAMTKVVEMLEGNHDSVPFPPKPYLCSPPGSPVGSSNA